MRDERTTTKTEARATQPMQWKLEAESRNCSFYDILDIKGGNIK